MKVGILAVFVLGAVAGPALAQTAAGTPAQPSPAAPLTLAQAIEYATDHYPAIKAALAQVDASSAGVDAARSAYLPRFDSVWQINRGTANNVFGQLFPQAVIPGLSGPVLDASSGQSVWGHAVGALFSWEPVDFGLRKAGVTGAEAAVTRARAVELLTRLDVENAVGDAFLTVLAAERTVAVAQADLDRRGVLRDTMQVLVTNQLRPGADQSRADAERAAAQTRLIQAQRALTLAHMALDRLLGSTTSVLIDGAPLLARLPPPGPPDASAAAHPLVQAHTAAVGQAKASEGVLATTDRPRLYVLASAFARGTGAETTGPFDGGLGGLRFDRGNWAAGVQVVFPNLFDFSTLRARRAAAAATSRAEAALADEAALTVNYQRQVAAALLESARAVAANTPVQLAAAQQSESQARARYAAGLASIGEVVDAQSLLAQAEAADQLARVDVWRALLASAVAQGDVAPFVALVRQP